MEHVCFLVKQFREALDKAYNSGKFKKLPFSRFPNDCCSHVSDLLYWYLLKNNVGKTIINGTNIYDSFWHHVWLETESKIIIDITCDQFNGRKEFSDFIWPIYVGTGNIVHEIFPITSKLNLQQFSGIKNIMKLLRENRILIKKHC